MSLFSRRREPEPERREVIPFGSVYFAEPNFANVDLSTAETSLQSVAVRATVDLIASLSSELPIDVYSGTGAARRALTTPNYLADPAGDGYGLNDWVYQVMMSWLLRGNVFGTVLARSSKGGFPTQIDLYHPDTVTGRLDEYGSVVWSVNGQRVTDVANFLHRRVHPVPGRVLGLSPIANHADEIGLSLSATRFGLQWFRDGAHPSGMLTNEETELNEGNAKTAKERFVAALRGNREPLVLGRGWKYQQIQVSPEESQFLMTQGYTEAQCARIFGPGFAEILGYDSGGSMTYANVESRSTHLLVYSLNKWFTRIERLLSEMLPGPQYVKINRDAMLQSTTIDRYRAHESALVNRWRTVNEIRGIEDLAPVAWGDEPNISYIGESTSTSETIQTNPNGGG